MPPGSVTLTMNREKALWEIRNEKNKASVRWVLILTIGSYLSYLFFRGDGASTALSPGYSGGITFDATYIFALMGFAVAFNAGITVLIHRALKKEMIGRWVKYLTMGCDFLLVALVLIPTGGSGSLLYPINYVVIVSNALRYGMSIALAGTFIMNVFYLGVLANQYWPDMSIPDFHQEVLKVAGFWLVGIYTGYLSRRYEILRGEVERYEKLLADALGAKGSAADTMSSTRQTDALKKNG